MATDPLDVDLDEHPLRPAPRTMHPARPAWPGFLGGVLVLAVGVVIAVGIWQFAGAPSSELTLAELTEAESLLDQLGFPPGPIDGVVDQQCRDAITDFQLTAGIEVDGELDLALLDELRAAKAELGGN